MLLNTPDGGRVASRLRNDGGPVHAPHLIDLEIAQVLRRYVGTDVLPARRASLALQHWHEFDLARYAHEPFLDRIWQLRDNLTAYDAAYVALAEVLEAVLITTDRRLAAVPGSRAVVEVPGTDF